MSLAVPSHMMKDFASKIKGVLGNRPETFDIGSKEGQSAFVGWEICG